MCIGGLGAKPPDDAFLLTFYHRYKQVKTLRKQAQTSLGNTLQYVDLRHSVWRASDLHPRALVHVLGCSVHATRQAGFCVCARVPALRPHVAPVAV